MQLLKNLVNAYKQLMQKDETKGKEPCGSCGATNYYYYRVTWSNHEKYETCSQCSTGPTPNLSPDVYFNPKEGRIQTNPNLCDRNGTPIPYSSKREKAAIMKRLGVVEAGDKKHGSRNFDRSAAKQWERLK